VGSELITSFYNFTLRYFASRASLAGFAPGKVPLSYIQRNYEVPILEHMKQFFKIFYSDDFLLQELRGQHIVSLAKPECTAMTLSLEQGATFHYDIATAPLSLNYAWRQAAFKVPSRKNYRDLDNQVISFIKEEGSLTESYQAKPRKSINHLDWVSFLITPVSSEHLPVLDQEIQLWMRVGNEEPDIEAQDIFLNHDLPMEGISKADFLQDYFSSSHDTQYTFRLKSIVHTPHTVFCFDSFKKYFKLKSDKEVHRKLIEVFSFRHDISQRRETVELALKILLKAHPFMVPRHLVAAEEVILLQEIYKNPDYYVYKARPDFKEKIALLAQKQIKERALIDAFAYNEHIEVAPEDILGYLNLLKRPKTKEFVYFSIPETRLSERERPLSHEMLYQACLREKTLNHIIRTLSRSA
jgi:hypothetical protein